MQPFPQQMTVTRRIEIDNTGAVSLNTTTAGPIGAQLYRSVETTLTAAREAPTPYNLRYRLRRYGSFLLRYRAKTLGTESPRLQAGDRVEIDGTAYEALSGARPMSLGQRLIAYEAPVAVVGDLYPLLATILDNEGEVATNVPLALTPAGDDIHTERGTYQDFDAEAPADYRDQLPPGRTLQVGTTRYRVRSSELILGVVRMSVRRAGG